MQLISIVAILCTFPLVFAIKVQDPIFHASKISGRSYPDKCDVTLDLTVKQNIKALYQKLLEKNVKRVWVSRSEVASFHFNKRLHLEMKQGRDLDKMLPFVCGSQPYRIKSYKGDLLEASRNSRSKEILKKSFTDVDYDSTKEISEEATHSDSTEILSEYSPDETNVWIPKVNIKKGTSIKHKTPRSSENEHSSEDTEVLSASLEEINRSSKHKKGQDKKKVHFKENDESESSEKSKGLKLTSKKRESSMSSISSPFPGLLHKLNVKDGDEVKAGDDLAVVKTMKMLTVIKAPKTGRVRDVQAQTGENLSPDQPFLFLETENE